MRILLVFSWLIISLLFSTTSSRAEETADMAIKESEQRLEKLERHIEALDRRLQASEQENARLRAEKPAIVPTSSQPDIKALDQKVKALEQRVAVEQETSAELAKRAPTTPQPDIKALDQKVKELEQRVEVQQETATELAKRAPKFEAGRSGLQFSSADGANFLKLRGSVQTDAKFFIDDKDRDKNPIEGSNLTNKFLLRQARLRLDGRLFKYYDFKIMPDFGGSSVRLNDAYIDAHYFSFASLNIGKQKAPVILERLQSNDSLTFLERAYPTFLAPNRDVGIMFHGEFARPGYKTEYGGPVDFKNLVSYQLGAFNGAGDNGFSNNTDIDDDKEFIGRIWAHPFQYSGLSPLEGFGIGVSGTWEHPKENSLSNLPSPNGQNTIVDYSKRVAGTTSLTADGDHSRVSPQAYWYYGPFGLLGEYVVSSQELLAKKGAQGTGFRQENEAWHVQASYVVTGENNTFQSVSPRNNFDPRNGGWGALQLAARWTELDIDDDTFAFLDPNKSVNHASTWTVGANWFLNKAMRFTANYEETSFDGGAAGGGDRQTEKIFSTRFQLSF